MKKSRAYTLKTTPELFSRVEAAAKAERRSVNWMLGELLDEALKVRERRSSRRKQR